MRAEIAVKVTRDDLETIGVGLKRSSRIAARRQICLALAEIARRSGRTKRVVWAWQARFIAEGMADLSRDKTRKLGKAPLLPGAGKAGR
jgi:hypothetical protein